MRTAIPFHTGSLLIALFLTLSPVETRAAGGAVDLDYIVPSGDLSGYANTWLDYYDCGASAGGCFIDEIGIWLVSYAGIGSNLTSPSGNTHVSGEFWDGSHALFYVPPFQPGATGVWTLNGFHAVYIDFWQCASAIFEPGKGSQSGWVCGYGGNASSSWQNSVQLNWWPPGGPAGVHGVNFISANTPYTTFEQQYLVDKLVETNAKWALLSVQWHQSEPDPPSTTNEGGDRWQGPSGKWHRYHLTALDTAMNRFPLNVAIFMTLFSHPEWAGGYSKVDPQNPGVGPQGFCRSCNIILNSHKAIFTEAVADFAAHLRWRYRNHGLRAFGPWNEPNNHFFSPETPYTVDLLSEYLKLVHIPVVNAIRNIENRYSLSAVLIAGPEISGYNSGDGWSSNWWYTNGNSQYRAQARTHWIDHWIDPLLRFVPSTIDVVTFHTYVPTYEGPASQAGIVKAKMNQLSQPKPIWITESNRAADESLSPVYDNQTQEGVLADYFCEVYRRMDGTAWQRTFFAMLHDGDIANVYQGSPRGKSLLKARDYEFDEKWLHEAFQAIVDGVYVCTGP